MLRRLRRGGVPVGNFDGVGAGVGNLLGAGVTGLGMPLGGSDGVGVEGGNSLGPGVEGGSIFDGDGKGE